MLIDSSAVRTPRSYWSMPQGNDKTASEQADFDVMLPNINLLYLFCSVLILADLSYVSRFWTQFEAYLSMRRVTVFGLDPTPLAKQRCVIKCIHNAPASFSETLIGMWSTKSAEEAYEVLVKPDVRVTNQSDKDVQLPKLKTLNAFAQRVIAESQALGA